MNFLYICSRSISLVALLLLSLFLGARRAEAAVVAYVNGDSVTTEMMVEELGRIHSSQMGTIHREDFSVERLLQKLINNILLAQEAQAIGMDTDSALVKAVRNYREGLAYRELLHDITPDSIEISDAELRAGFADNFRRYQLSFISVADSALSGMLRDSILAGVSMADLARRHSVDKFKETGGDAGTYALIDLPVDLQSRIRVSPIGTLLKPFSLQRVWALIRIDTELPPDSALFDSVAVPLRNLLRDQKRTAIRRDYIEKLRAEYPVVIDSAQVDSVIIAMQAGAPASDKAVVTVGNGRTLTALEIRNKYIHRIAGSSDRQAHDVLYETLGEQIEIMLLKESASRSSYIDNPRFDVATDALRDSLLINSYLADVIAPTVVVADSAIENYYAQHQSDFRMAKRVKIATIARATAEEAQADYDKLVAGADFAWLAKQNSTDDLAPSGGAHDWMTLDEFPEPLRSELDTMSIGAILPPMSLQEGQIIFKLLDHEPGAILPLEKVQAKIQSSLLKRAQFEAIDAAVQELRKAAEIRTFEDVLQSIRITGPKDVEE